MWRCSASATRPAGRCGCTYQAGEVPSPTVGTVALLLWSDGERPVELVDLPAISGGRRGWCCTKRRWRCPRRGCPAGTVTEQDKTRSATAAGVG